MRTITVIFVLALMTIRRRVDFRSGVDERKSCHDHADPVSVGVALAARR